MIYIKFISNFVTNIYNVFFLKLFLLKDLKMLFSQKYFFFLFLFFITYNLIN